MKILRVYMSDTGKLPEILVGCSIEITPRRVNFRTATVLEVIEHREDFVQVRDDLKRLDGRVARLEHGQAKLEGLLEGLREAITRRKVA